MSKEVYDETLSSIQKVVMLKNGGFSFDRVKQSTCCCSHDMSEHLDYTYVCLSKEPCICERFLDKDAKITISPQKQHKIPYKEERKEKLEDSQIAGYIQTLAKI